MLKKTLKNDFFIRTFLYNRHAKFSSKDKYTKVWLNEARTLNYE